MRKVTVHTPGGTKSAPATKHPAAPEPPAAEDTDTGAIRVTAAAAAELTSAIETALRTTLNTWTFAREGGGVDDEEIAIVLAAVARVASLARETLGAEVAS